MINPLWVMWFFIGLTVFTLSIWTLIKYDDWEEKRNCPHSKYCGNCVYAIVFVVKRPCKKCNEHSKFKCQICEGRKHV